MLTLFRLAKCERSLVLGLFSNFWITFLEPRPSKAFFIVFGFFQVQKDVRQLVVTATSKFIVILYSSGRLALFDRVTLGSKRLLQLSLSRWNLETFSFWHKHKDKGLRVQTVRIFAHVRQNKSVLVLNCTWCWRVVPWLSDFCLGKYFGQIPKLSEFRN